jgi:hypothetical protein
MQRRLYQVLGILGCSTVLAACSSGSKNNNSGNNINPQDELQVTPATEYKTTLSDGSTLLGVTNLKFKTNHKVNLSFGSVDAHDSSNLNFILTALSDKHTIALNQQCTGHQLKVHECKIPLEFPRKGLYELIPNDGTKDLPAIKIKVTDPLSVKVADGTYATTFKWYAFNDCSEQIYKSKTIVGANKIKVIEATANIELMALDATALAVPSFDADVAGVNFNRLVTFHNVGFYHNGFHIDMAMPRCPGKTATLDINPSTQQQL